MGPIDGSELGGVAHWDRADGAAAIAVLTTLSVLRLARANERQGGRRWVLLACSLRGKMVAPGKFLGRW
jgi:hypothetical protein